MRQEELDAIRKRGSFVGQEDAELSLAESDRRNLLAEVDRLRNRLGEIEPQHADMKRALETIQREGIDGTGVRAVMIADVAISKLDPAYVSFPEAGQ